MFAVCWLDNRRDTPLSIYCHEGMIRLVAIDYSSHNHEQGHSVKKVARIESSWSIDAQWSLPLSKHAMKRVSAASLRGYCSRRELCGCLEYQWWH